MSVFDRIGSFYDHLKSLDSDIPGPNQVGNDINAGISNVIGNPSSILGKLGAAYSAGSHPDFGNALLNTVAQQVTNQLDPATILMDDPSSPMGKLRDIALKGISIPYSYGVARPLSTIAQIDTTGDTGFFSPSQWNKAWDDSRSVSVGQALTSSAVDTTHDLVGTPEPGFLKGDDPFSRAAAPQRAQFFSDNWGGKLTSGAIDAVIGWEADPVTIGSKIAKVGEKANSVVQDADRSSIINSLRPAQIPSRVPTPEEKSAIGAYSAHAAKTINNNLRQGIEHEDDFKETDNGLTSAINNSPVTTQDTSLTRIERGAQGNTFLPANVAPGDTVSSPAYLSASKTEEAASKFRKFGQNQTVLRINVPAGHRVLDVNAALGTDGFNAGEKEVILPKGSKLRIDSVNDNDSMFDPVEGKNTPIRSVAATLVNDIPQTPNNSVGTKTLATGAKGWEAKLQQKLTNPNAQSAKLKTLVDKTLNTPTGMIPSMPEYAGHADAGALAQAVARAKEINPDNVHAQRQAVLDVIGTAWGDSASMANLTASSEPLAQELQRLSQAPRQAVAAATTGTLDNGAAAFSAAQADPANDVTARMNEVDAELQTLNKVMATQSTLTPRVTGTVRENAAYARKVSRINQTTLHNGIAGPVMRVVGGQLSDRLPGHVNIKDPVAGYQDMLGYLKNSPLIPDVKHKLLDSFVSAPSADARQSVVRDMNDMHVAAAGHKYGLNEKAINAIIKDKDTRINYIRSAIASRLYGVSDENAAIGIYDPEEDSHDVFSRPIAKSQIEDMHPALDPSMLDKTFKSATKNRLLDRAGYTGAADSLENFAHLSDEAMAVLQRRWKDSALMRFAYPLRILTDSNLRLMLHMDTATVLGSRWTTAKGVGHYLLTKPDIEGVTQVPMSIRSMLMSGGLKNLTKEGDLHGALSMQLKRSVSKAHPEFDLNEDDIDKISRTILSTGGGMADLANEMTSAKLQKIRTGDWRIFDHRDPEYLESYKRVLNQQINNSPALRALFYNDVFRVTQEVRRQMVQGGKLADEWREVKAGYPYGIEDWLSKGKAMVDHYLPTDSLRSHMYGPEDDGSEPKMVNDGMLKRIFFSKEPEANPPKVHGEMYHMQKQADLTAWYNEKRNRFFTIMADMPETVMSRSPLFWDSYRRNIASQIRDVGEETISSQRVDEIRKNAMSQARREMGSVLYDASDVSNLSHTMRYLSPFFTAWEDTMRKYSNLIYDNPEYLPRLNQLSHSLNNAGMVVDSNGNMVNGHGQTFDKEGNLITDPNYDGEDQYVLLPKKLTEYIPKLNKLQAGGQLKIRKDSINSVFQGQPWWLPGFGPAVQVPANYVVRQLFPKEADDPVMKYVLPYGTTTDSPVTQLMPKWAKDVKDTDIFGNTKSFNNQYGIFLAQATVDNDHKPLSGKQLKAVQNKTRNYFIAKAFVDNASPVSIQPDAKYQLYIDKAREYRNDPKRGADWEDQFFNDYPGFGEMAISLSANNTGIQATNAAQDASIKYRADIRKNPDLGWLFVGPSNSGNFSNGVYDWQMTNNAGNGLNFRGSKDPQVALTSLQAEQGWNTWNSVNTAINLKLKSRGLYSTSQKGAEDLQAAKSEFRQQLAQSNPAWAASQASSSQGGAGRLIQAAMTFMGSHSEVQSRSDMQALQAYIQVRDAVKIALSQRSNVSLAYNPDLQSVLDGAGQSLSTANIGFEQMYNRELQYDDLSDLKVQNGQLVSVPA